MEVMRSSESSVNIYYTTWHHIQKIVFCIVIDVSTLHAECFSETRSEFVDVKEILTNGTKWIKIVHIHLFSSEIPKKF
jgi:hypothetical protein